MDSYEVVRQIGEGAFGKAFLVRHREAGGDSQCVLKQVDLRKMSAQEKEASRREVTLMSKMRHNNIVSFITSFHDRDSLYIVMEFCDGGDLMSRISSQRGVPFTEHQILDWFVQICLGLKHIHDQKILHRDVKAQNIFLCSRGFKVKLGDFGIARMLENTMELARTCVGTPYYLSPEICESRPYNNKTDVWSLGCVLYELCTLKHPFEGSSLRQLLARICRGRYSPVPRRYSWELRQLLAQLFKVNPRDRPSVSSVLRRPVLEKPLSRHLEPQTERGPNTAAAAAAAAEKETRAAPRPGPAGGRFQPRPGGKVPVLDQHRVHYQNLHAQLDALQRRPQEAIPPPPPPPAAPAPAPPPPPPAPQERCDPPAVEPFQLVEAARHEYLQRRRQAAHNKLRAEKQLGLRPSTAELHPRTREQDVGRPEHQHPPEDRRKKQQDYLHQLDLIRQQYHQDMDRLRVRAGAQQLQQRTFVVHKLDSEPEASTEQQRPSPGQDFEAALMQIREEPRTERRSHKDQKGIMFEIRLDEEQEEEEQEEQEEQEEHEGKETREESEEAKEEEVDLLNRTLSFQEGEELKLRDWSEQRRGWSQRTPQTLLDALAQMDATSASSTAGELRTSVKTPQSRRQWVGHAPNTLLQLLAQTELRSTVEESLGSPERHLNATLTGPEPEPEPQLEPELELEQQGVEQEEQKEQEEQQQEEQQDGEQQGEEEQQGVEQQQEEQGVEQEEQGEQGVEQQEDGEQQGEEQQVQKEEEEEEEESDSDVEVDEERLEPRSDDDDTNFEESEDELRAAVVDSMRNLFVPDEAAVHDGIQDQDQDQDQASGPVHSAAGVVSSE